MASFDYLALHVYNAADLTFVGTDTDPGTATDQEGIADTTFEAGDTFVATLEDPNTGVPFDATLSYDGFIDFLGESLPLAFIPVSELPADLQLLFPSGGYAVADFRDPTTITAPATLDLSSLNSDPYTVCFAAGTAIATPSGETPVQDLTIGDPVLTADGRTVPVKWIGVQTVSTRFGPAERLRPVRVTAGALGDGLPRRDLTLTADHALLVDGLLVNAGALVNGTTIHEVPLSESDGSYTVYHVETEDHDLILANATPAETYIDYAARRAFDNHAGYLALYGEHRTIPEMARPRISAARHLPDAIRARLAGAAAA